MKIDGKMNSTSGKRIFTGSLAAFSRAHCRRFERISSAGRLQHPAHRHAQRVGLGEREHEVR